jgi:hypothetical protein
MKLMSVSLARSAWLFDLTDINPGGKDIFTHLIPPLLEDYKFKTHPKPGEDFSSSGMKFTQGEFVKEDGTVIIVNLTIWKDGVWADSFSSTSDSDEFIKAVSLALPELGFAFDPEMVNTKLYLSQLQVRCDKALSALNPRLSDLAEKVASAGGGETKFAFSGIEFWPDQTKTVKPAVFSFQRRVGDPFSSNRYWSQAALSTSKHLELLDELEAILP